MASSESDPSCEGAFSAAVVGTIDADTGVARVDVEGESTLNPEPCTLHPEP